jgi:CelD/BcsL family acetyltransferase involved in cellulose biosynthesis
MLSKSENSRFSVLVDHLTVDVITSIEQFKNLSQEWNSLFNSCNNLSVFQTFTWNYVWFKHYGVGKELSIFTIRENNTLVGIAPFMVKSRLGCKEFEPICGEYHYNFSLIMDCHRDDVATAIALKFSERFPKGVLHIPYFLPDDNSLNVFMAALNTEGWNGARWTRNISYYISEINGFNNYMSYKSRKSRYNLKRERTRLEEEGLINLTHSYLDDLTDKLVERIGKIQEKSWLSRRGQESLAEPFFKEVIPALAKNNHAEIFLYEQNGEDIAYIFNLYSGNTCYCFFIGFIETKKHLSPGKSLMMDNLQKVLDRGITVYDFLYGEGEYKRFWANRIKFACRSVCYKGFRGWVLSWIPHRLHGSLAKYDQLRHIVSLVRRYQMKLGLMK